jgi:hypothetical protein
MSKNDLEKYGKALIRMRAKAFPFAMLKANNLLGQRMWVEWKKEVRKTMTTRNRWTKRSIKLIRSRRPVIDGMRVIVGSRAPYMKTNEEGGTVKAEHGQRYGMGSPTLKARTGGSYSGLVAGAKKIKRANVKARHGSSRKQRNAIQIKQARKNRKNFALIEKSSGGFLFMQAKGKGKRSKLNTLFSLRKTVKVPRNPMMQRALKKTLKYQKSYTLSALKREIAQVKARTGL